MTGEGGLRRELGLAGVTASGIGIILGAGIYALLGEATGLAGNAVWLSFGIAAVMAACTALSYAELSSMFPQSGRDYAYARTRPAEQPHVSSAGSPTPPETRPT